MTKAQLLAVGSTAGLCPGRTGGMMSDQIVMRDSDEAAQPVTIQAWKARDGHIYFDESTARYAGSTHCLCNTCGAPTPKTYLKCDACREKADLAKYEAMPRAEWDGEAMLYSEARDQYYSTPDDAADELEEDQTLADLRLVICEPNYVRQLMGVQDTLVKSRFDPTGRAGKASAAEYAMNDKLRAVEAIRALLRMGFCMLGLLNRS